jgi:cytochrome c553
MKTLVKVLGGLVLLVLLAAGSGFVWAKTAVSSKLNRSIDVHSVDFPIPFPLGEVELAALREERKAEQAQQAQATDDAAEGDGEDEAAPEGAGEAPEADEASADEDAADEQAADADAADEEAADEDAVDDSEADDDESAPKPSDPLEGVDLEKLARARALARGKHLVQARYACIECHGKDFSGGVMVDDPALGTLLGPNLTSGEGSVTVGFTPADWDRIVRHGVKKDGTPAAMPSEDFQSMSDQELSDIVTYILAQPPVDNVVPKVSLGPLGTVLMATGKLPLSADLIHDHHAKHASRPPQADASAEFGKHLAGICTGCHRPNFEGGPIAAGPPDWVPARNLSPHEQGLKGWSYEQFATAMREGKRPDGTDLKMPMSLMMPYAKKMTDTEIEALWAYLSSLPAVPTGT